MDIKILSTEYVKPSSPTPTHLKSFKHSLLDQMHQPQNQLIPFLLFYPAKPKPESEIPYLSPDISHLKACLSKTLSSFYPLAGRYESWGFTHCNDKGVPFVEAKVNQPLSLVLNSTSDSKLDLLKFYPPLYLLEGTGVHLAVQINVFTCGGFILGFYHMHKLTDGISAATFLRHWAAIATNRLDSQSSVKPDFLAPIIAFPPVQEEERPKLPYFEDGRKPFTILISPPSTVRSFVFTNAAINELKTMSTSEQVPKPSKFLTVACFIWQQIMSAKLSPPSEDKDEDEDENELYSALSTFVDVRSRVSPPLPEGSIGNIVKAVAVRAKKGADLEHLVAELYASISKAKDEISKYKGERMAHAMKEDFISQVMVVWPCMKELTTLTAWCKAAGCSDVDFGFGKPKWIIPTNDRLNSDHQIYVILTDYVGDSDSDEDRIIEAWLFLEEKRMMSLLCNDKFLSFATPRF